MMRRQMSMFGRVMSCIVVFASMSAPSHVYRLANLDISVDLSAKR